MTSFDRIQDFQILNSLGNDQGYARKGNWKREKNMKHMETQISFAFGFVFAKRKMTDFDWQWDQGLLQSSKM